MTLLILARDPPPLSPPLYCLTPLAPAQVSGQIDLTASSVRDPARRKAGLDAQRKRTAEAKREALVQLQQARRSYKKLDARVGELAKRNKKLREKQKRIGRHAQPLRSPANAARGATQHERARLNLFNELLGKLDRQLTENRALKRVNGVCWCFALFHIVSFSFGRSLL